MAEQKKKKKQKEPLAPQQKKIMNIIASVFTFVLTLAITLAVLTDKGII